MKNDDTLANLKNLKLSDSELRFLKDYRRLEDLEREKGIKFFECIGDPPATDGFKDGVAVQRQNFIHERLDEMRAGDTGRFASEINADKVLVPVITEVASAPKWDVYKNNHFTMRKRLVTIFLKVANRMIIRKRAGKRLLAIKKKLADEKVTNRAECKKMVAEDWKNSLNARLESGDGETDNIDNIKYSFSFSRKELTVDIKLPLEYETNISSFMEKIDAAPVISFDDLEPVDPIE